MLDHDALPDERQQAIHAKLLKAGRVIAADLAAEFGVSEHTIRRDLGDLMAAGVCKRVYGGAILISPAQVGVSQRATQNTERKDALGRAAAALLKANQCVFLDAGTTNLAIARAIDREMPLTLVTNAPAIAHELATSSVQDIILLGGRLSRDVGGALGITALHQVQQISFDQCIVGACAFDAKEGLTVFDFDDAEFKRALLARSGVVVAAVTNEKLSSIARYAVAACSEVSMAIVEQDAPPDQLQWIREAGVDIVVASKP